MQTVMIPLKQMLVLCLCLVSFPALLAGSGAPDGSPPHGSAESTKTPDLNIDQGKITHVKWDGGLLLFKRQDVPFRYDLEDRSLTEDSPPDPKEAEIEKKSDKKSVVTEKAEKPPKKGRTIPRPGRGRQYMTEPSPDGQWYAVCKDWNVVLENDETDEKIQVTTEGHRKLRFGTANWVYGEEIGVRHGMWWSPDSRFLIFYRFDERLVKDYYLTGDLTEFNTRLLTEGYMKPGAPNPVVSLLIFDFDKKKVFPADLGEWDETEPPYLFNMRFTPDGSELLINRANRLQQRLEVLALDYRLGTARPVIKETQETWQDNHPTMRFLDDGKHFIWRTEETGWRQYTLHHLDGHRVRTLTKGEYPVSRIVDVDEEKGWLWYSAYSDDQPLCLQLHKVRLDGTSQQRLTRHSMHHSRFNLSPDRQWFTVQYENVETPPSTALYTMEGELVTVVAQGATDENPQTELFRFKADDNETDLYGLLQKPEGFDPNAKYPLVVSVYGGPGSRSVRNRYQWNRRLSRPGYLVAQFDNRGTSGRGKKFKGMVYRKLGHVDIGDQAQGVRFLAGTRPYVDGSRVGIVGHSYGGFMAAMGVMKFPDVFHAAVAGSAVTDWRHYDSIYTERYMGLPQDNAMGYVNGSCMTYVDRYKGNMLIIHGLLDDNVHPNNAWQLIHALNEAGKPYECRFFPKAGHSTGNTRHLQWAFFDKHLKVSKKPVLTDSK